MLKDMTLGQYYQTDSVIHKLDPRVKIGGTLLYIISLFIFESAWGYVLAAVFLGMVIKFAEATLSVRYRIVAKDGNYVGGPMYIVQQGMQKKYHYLAYIYCFFGVVAAFGVGSATQINAVLGGINGAIVACGGQESKIVNILIGAILSILIMIVFLGGAKRISNAAALIVPFASVFYLALCLGVLLLNISEVPLLPLQ